MNVTSATESQRLSAKPESRKSTTEDKKPEIVIIDSGYVLPIPSFDHAKIVDIFGARKELLEIASSHYQ